MNPRTIVTIFVLAVLVGATMGVASCGKKQSLVGSYTLVTTSDKDGKIIKVDPHDWTLSLVLQPDGRYLMVEIEDGEQQGKWSGDYIVRNDQLELMTFNGDFTAVFSFKFAEGMLTLDVTKMGNETENLPNFHWNFKKQE